MQSIRNLRKRKTQTGELNITPLIDIVFILLIFFIVTTSFVKEAGVEVKRPLAATAVTQEKTALMIGLDKAGVIYLDGKSVDIRSFTTHIEQWKAKNPESAALVVADRQTPTGRLIQVLDLVRLAGVENVSIAAQQENVEY